MDTFIRAALSNAVSATVLAILVVGLGRALGRRPAVMHCLWLLVLLKLVTPPLYELPIPRLGSPNAGSSRVADGGVIRFVVQGSDGHSSSLIAAQNLKLQALLDPNTARPGLHRIVPSAIITAVRDYGLPSAVGIWVVGTVATLFVTVRRIRRFQTLLNEAQPAHEDVQEWVEDLAARLGLSRSPRAYWVSGRLSPMLWAIGRRPRLIIPTELWKKLDEHQRLTLIVHELAHLRRGDHHVRLFELVVTALYWWHPVLWWSRKALHNVEEQCCDAWVVWTFPDSARCYAETLLEAIDFLHHSDRPEPLLASGFGKAHHLRRRLTMIMTGTTPRLRGAWGTLGSLGLAAVLLPINPTWAQKPETESESIQVLVDKVETSGKVDEPKKDGDADVRKTSDEDKKRELDRTRASIEELEKVRAELTAKIDSMRQKLKETGNAPVVDVLELKSAKLLNKLVLLKSSTPGAETRTTTSEVHVEGTPKPAKVLLATPMPRTVTVEGVRAQVIPSEKHLTFTFVNPAQIKNPVVVVEEPRAAQPVNEPVVIGGAPERARAITIHGMTTQLSDKARIEQLEKRLEALLNEVATLKNEQKGASRPNGGLAP